MHKLIIIVEQLDDSFALNDNWPKFLRLAEGMPGLKQESAAQVNNHLYGNCQVDLIHELFFDTQEDLQRAMVSPLGRAAG